MSENETKPNVAKEVSVLEKTQLAGKLGAVSIPLTYVSGYLISTSYLGTYGLHLNGGELFRAKYIYIGFQYLMFLVLMFAIFAVVYRVVELSRLFGRKNDLVAQKLFKHELENALKTLQARNSNFMIRNYRKFNDLRGDFVVGLIVSVLTIEVMLLNPEKLGGILPFQVIYLLAVVVYQLTFYRELFEPFAWGLVHGSVFIEDNRWLLLFAQIFSAISIFYRMAINAFGLKGEYVLYFEWFLVAVTLEIIVLSLVSILASKERLIAIDKHPRFNQTLIDENVNILKSMSTFRALTGVRIGYFMPCMSRNPLWFRIRRAFYLVVTFVAVTYCIKSHFFSLPPNWVRFLLVVAPLLLSLMVLTNVSFLPALFHLRAQRLGYVDTPNKDEFLPEKAAANNIMREKWKRYVRRAIMAIVLYLTSVLSFGFVIYPHIPVQKAGGNYETANKLCIVPMKEEPLQQCPNDLLPSLAANDAYVALDEDSDYVYLANDHDKSGGSDCWSWAGMNNSYCRPRVYAVSRKCIAAIVDALPEGPTNMNEPRCPTDSSASTANKTNLLVIGSDAAHNSIITPLSAQSADPSISKPSASVK